MPFLLLTMDQEVARRQYRSLKPNPSAARLLVAIILLLSASVSQAQTAAEKSDGKLFSPAARLRPRISLNAGWKFIPGDVEGAESIGFDEHNWTSVDLPHTWNGADTLDDEPGYRRGAGWYRKNLYLERRLKGRRLFLYFEGANQVTDVFVNGKLAGQHTGGYTAFAFEITELARFDATDSRNTLAVKVDNSHNKDIPPLSADFNFYGGIYRNVWLIATEPVHLTLSDHASTGVYVDTPKVSAARATVRVRGAITNATDQPKQVRVSNTVVDAEGHKVAATDSSVSIEPRKEASFQQLIETIPAPHLWSPERPYLYTVYTQVHDGDRAIDIVENSLGFRWFSFAADQGFLLNGKPLKLRGTNRHQDYVGLGNALPNWMQIRDLKLIKEMGANFVRLAHYPQASVVLETADRLGLIIWEEIPIVNAITPDEEFTSNCKQMLTEMIRQHYNHPAVLMWGYMNEVLLRPEKSEGYLPRVVELARTLDQVCRREDPTRVTVMAMHESELYNTSGLADVPQVVGWNIYAGWYHGAFPEFGQFLDDQHKRFPRRPMIVSEYGGDCDPRLHSFNPQRFDYTIEWQRLLHESYLKQLEERPYVLGSALWIAFDFGSESRGESKPHLNQKGLFTSDRRPKDIYYFYQAKLSSQGVLHIASRDWPNRTGTNQSAQPGSGEETAAQPLEVYTNLPEVELSLDGRSLGTKRVDTLRKSTWLVPFHDGLNVLEANGRRGPQRFSDRVEVRFTYRASVLADPAAPFSELAVNVGSNAQFTDAAGLAWEADQPYLIGGWGYLGGTAEKISNNILGSAEDPLYQTMRQGLEGYRFDLPDGDYELELRFVEPRFNQPGERVFTVAVNRELAIEQLDLVKEYGALRGVTCTIHARAEHHEGILLKFGAITDKPVLSAIRIRLLP